MVLGMRIGAAACVLCSLGVAWADAPPKGGADSAPKKASSLEGQGKSVKYKNHTSIDMDEANIDGSFKAPFASSLEHKKEDFNSGFIKLRTDFHDQMIKSVSGLSN